MKNINCFRDKYLFKRVLGPRDTTMLYELTPIIGTLLGVAIVFTLYVVLPVAIITTVICSIVKSYFWD